MKINHIKQKIEKAIHAIQYNELKFAFSLIGICFILRIAVALLTFSEDQVGSWADSKEFLWFGEQFSLGNFNPHWDVENHGLEVGPFIPLLIAVFIKLFPSPMWPFFVYNCLVTSIIPLVLYLIGKNIFNRKVGLFSAFWSIFSTDFFRYNIQFLKEPTVYLFFPLAVLFIILSIKNKNRIIYIFGSSTAFSILMHADPRYFFIFPILLIPYLFINWTFFQRIKKIFLWIIICIIFSTPMLIRNYNVYGEIIFISPQTIAITNILWESNIEPYNQSFNQQRLDKAVGFFDSDKFKTAEEKYYENRLENALIESGGKGRVPYKYGNYEKYFMTFQHYWQPIFFFPNYLYYGFRYQKWSIKHNISSMMFYGIYLPFYFIGIYFLSKKRNLFGIYLAIIPLFHCVMHVYASLGLERYRSHINFCIILIAFWTIIQFFSYYRLNNKTISQ
jgi:hypothetical protein